MNKYESHLMSGDVETFLFPRTLGHLSFSAISAIQSVSLLRVCLHVWLCVHDTAEPLGGVHKLPHTQTDGATN